MFYPTGVLRWVIGGTTFAAAYRLAGGSYLLSLSKILLGLAAIAIVGYIVGYLIRKSFTGNRLWMVLSFAIVVLGLVLGFKVPVVHNIDWFTGLWHLRVALAALLLMVSAASVAWRYRRPGER